MKTLDEFDVVKRQQIYDSVWKAIKLLAKEAAPESITPETFSRISVDIVLTELRRAGAISRVFTDK